LAIALAILIEPAPGNAVAAAGLNKASEAASEKTRTELGRTSFVIVLPFTFYRGAMCRGPLPPSTDDPAQVLARAPLPLGDLFFVVGVNGLKPSRIREAAPRNGSRRDCLTECWKPLLERAEQEVAKVRESGVFALALKPPPELGAAADRRPLHNHEAGALQMLHKSPGYDLGHDLVGVVRPLAAVEAQREGERRGEVFGGSRR